MKDGSSKTLVITGTIHAWVESVAISSDGRLVAAGSYDGVRNLQYFVGMYAEFSSYR